MKLLLLLLLLPISAISQINYTVDVLRLKANADNCDGGLPFCLNAPQDPVINIWSNDAAANENTYCWIFEDDPLAEYGLWIDIQNLQIANETNVLTTYITFDMSGFESDNLTTGCEPSVLGGDDAVMGRQLAQNFDLSFIPEGQPYLTTIDIGTTYYAEIEIFWIDASANIDDLVMNQFSIVPNPSEGQIYIKAPADSDLLFDVQILDMMGRLIHTKEDVMANETIDLSMIDPGTYFIQYTSDNKIGVEQIVLK